MVLKPGLRLLCRQHDRHTVPAVPNEPDKSTASVVSARLFVPSRLSFAVQNMSRCAVMNARALSPLSLSVPIVARARVCGKFPWGTRCVCMAVMKVKLAQVHVRCNREQSCCYWRASGLVLKATNSVGFQHNHTHTCTLTSTPSHKHRKRHRPAT